MKILTSPGHSTDIDDANSAHEIRIKCTLHAAHAHNDFHMPYFQSTWCVFLCSCYRL